MFSIVVFLYSAGKGTTWCSCGTDHISSPSPVTISHDKVIYSLLFFFFSSSKTMLKSSQGIYIEKRELCTTGENCS